MDMNQAGPACRCPHHSVTPFLIVLIGLLFMLHAFGYFSEMMVNVVWPILLILIGLQKMFGRMCGCCRH